MFIISTLISAISLMAFSIWLLGKNPYYIEVKENKNNVGKV